MTQISEDENESIKKYEWS